MDPENGQHNPAPVQPILGVSRFGLIPIPVAFMPNKAG